MALRLYFFPFATLAVIASLATQRSLLDLWLGLQLSHIVLIILGSNTLLFALWKAWVYPSFLDPLRHLPSPRGGLPLIRYGPEQFKRPPSEKVLGSLNSIPNDGLLRYPGFFGHYRLLPTSPKILSELLVTKSYDFQKEEQGRDILRLILGDGLVVAEGDGHRFQRKNLNPMFSFRHIKDLYPLMWGKAMEMVQCVRAEIGAFGDGKDSNGFILEVNQLASRATLDIIGVAALGKEFNTLRNADDELVQLYDWLLQPKKERLWWFLTNLVLTRHIAKRIPWKIEKEIGDGSVKLRQVCREFVKDKEAAMKVETVESVDTLAHLIRSNNFSNNELVDQILTFLAAGLHLGTLHAGQNPHYQNLLRNEVRAVIGSSALNATDMPSTLAPALDSLPYLNAICAETLRLYPSVPNTFRVAVRNTSLGSYPIPPGTRFIITPWLINRSPHLWGPKAGEFLPERWIDFPSPDKKGGKFNNHGGAPSNYALLTFLHGPRACIGQGFARSELRALVAAWVLAFEFEMRDPAENALASGMVTVKPKDGLWLRVRPTRQDYII
ncbi:cytochrome P450 [Zopfia rhizophila CBS 207.26]|uniref:Cytochrome P450 n=1 Tax=Zopfia rhizophila CBS 207.26 TaxID=1314779 RepID=A0A6A6DME9_9PEZI|nr:cytochrome P450 [Zopfia rhizophila CBS 207.26]